MPALPPRPASSPAPPGLESLIVPSRILEPLATTLRRGVPLVWVEPSGRALLGWGERHRLRASGPDRLSVLARDFAALGLPAKTRAFVTATFADDSTADSVLIVPEVTALWADGVLTADGDVPPPSPASAADELDLLPGTLTRAGFRHAVEEALREIELGRVQKVVLARDLLATGPDPVDLPGVLARMACANPTAYTFHVDGMFGSSPELLVKVDGGAVSSRVLAGSAPVTGEGDDERAAALAASAKDVAEHVYAVDSVAEALAEYAEIEVAATEVLRLPTIMHLATPITGRLRDQAGVLDVVAAVHPSAAVCGTPTAEAAALLRRLEGFDRGRYAGPVGWVGAAGNGTFAIALRCGQLEDGGRSVRLYAGGGIVAGSDPSAELAETAQKFLPVYQALSPLARP